MAAYSTVADPFEATVAAVAAMLAEAGRKGKPAAADEPRLAVSPRALFQAVVERCPDKVLCDPVDGRWFGRLGGVLKQLPDFEQADVERLCAWLAAGGCRTWPTGVPTFGHLITQLDKWVAFAREWDRRGRSALYGKTSVGPESSPESTDFSAFSTPRL